MDREDNPLQLGEGRYVWHDAHPLGDRLITFTRDELTHHILAALEGHAVIDGQLRKLVERVLHTNIREVSNAEDMWTEWDDVTAYVLDSEVSR